MAATLSERVRMGTPHRDLEAALRNRPFPDLTNGNPKASVQEIRQNRTAHLASLRHLYPIPGPIPDQVKESHVQIPVRDGTTISAKVYTPTKPASPDQGRPLIVMFHEGGWCMGDLTDEDLNCRMFARDLCAVCVNIDYRLAPEYTWPTGIEDAEDAIRWCAENASPASDVLRADPTQGFIVGGASAGGNIAAALCQIARDQGLKHPLTGQYLCVPALLHAAPPEKWRPQYHSRKENVHDPVIRLDQPSPLSSALKANPTDTRYSPLLHDDLGNLPPAFFQISGLDPLRDGGLLYERILREENGASTKLNVYDGFGHMFWTNWPELRQSHEFVQDTLSGMEWLLDVGTRGRIKGQKHE